MSTISLCIPAYNAAWCLPRLLASAANQTSRFDEIWVYDDCSADDTAAVAERYGARVVRGEVNRGCSHGKNVLAQQSGAHWIHFHDADDELQPHFVALARRWMQDNRFDVVLFPYEVRDEATGAVTDHRRFDDNRLRADARSYAILEQINAICGLYRRSAFLAAGGYDEDPLVLYNEDVAMHVCLAFAGLTFAAEHESCIINYLQRSSMSSSNQLRCLHAHYHVMKKTAELPQAGAYAQEIAERLWLLSGGLTAQLDWKAADAAVRLAVALAGRKSVKGGAVFRALTTISPYLALRAREVLIRTVKPRYRAGYPGWRASLGGNP